MTVRLATTNTADDFHRRVDKSAECWIWTASKDKKGYGHWRIGGKLVKAHRYAYEMANGTIEGGLFVCHSCDNPSCVNPDHLFLGTVQDNSDDMVAKGRSYRAPSKLHSENHPLSKLTTPQARAIRTDPRLPRVIAAEYGVSPNLVRGIKRGTFWKYA